jgi:general secretion pathway protein C
LKERGEGNPLGTSPERYRISGATWRGIAVVVAVGMAIGFAAIRPQDIPWKWWKPSASAPSTPPVTIQKPPPTPQPAAFPAAAKDLRAGFPGIWASKEPRPLILTGTVVGSHPGEGSAFIATDERNPQTYAIGAVLANGARLAEVAKDHVILQKDGRSVRLDIQNVKSRGRPVSDLLMVGGVQPAVTAKPTHTETFTQFIRTNPVYEGNVLSGYEVYPGQKAGVFGRLGLRPGDVITALDGARLTDAGNAMHLLAQLASGLAMRATVKRSGKTEELSLDGALMKAELDGQSPDRSLAGMPGMPPG